MAKETVCNMIEKGFYTGAAATVGILCVAAAPEIAVACVIGVVSYKAIDRMVDQYTDAKSFWKAYKSQKAE